MDASVLAAYSSGRIQTLLRRNTALAFGRVRHLVVYAIPSLLTASILTCIALYTWQDFFIYIPHPKQQLIANNSIRLLHLNVLGTNRHTDAAAQIIRSTKADIITLVEYNQYWQTALEDAKIFNNYPYRYTVKFGNDGIYSKLPLTHCQTVWISKRQNRITACDLQLKHSIATLLLVHPKPPVKRQWHLLQKELFDYLGENRHLYRKSLILAGDLNTSPWTSSFKTLTERMGIMNTRKEFGLYPTWRSDKWPIHLPLDHILLSPDFEVLNIQTGKPFGSDHIPLLIQFRLASKRQLG